ncbi:MAG: outer membrane beta-barrel protein [Gemmatimonadota bacterium]
MPTAYSRAFCLTLGAGFCLLAPAPAAAQGAGTSFGIQAGGGVADQRGSDAFFVWDVASPQGGVFINFPLGTSGRLGLQVEALVVGKGGRENTDRRLIPSSDPGVKQRQLFFQVPVLLRVELGRSSIRPVVFSGFAAAFSLNCRIETFAGSISDKQDCSDLGLPQRTSQFDVVVGAGLNIDAGPGVFLVDFRADVQVGSADDSAASLDVANRDLAVLVGYRFPVGSR